MINNESYEINTSLNIDFKFFSDTHHLGIRRWYCERCLSCRRCRGRIYYAPDGHVVYCHCCAEPEAEYIIGHTEVTNNNHC